MERLESGFKLEYYWPNIPRKKRKTKEEEYKIKIEKKN
jgi:hypothetical protein